MTDSDKNQGQQPSDQNQSNQRTDKTPQPAPEPSHIPSSADQDLASTMNKGLRPNSSIPSKPDVSLRSTKTMNEEGVKRQES